MTLRSAFYITEGKVCSLLLIIENADDKDILAISHSLPLVADGKCAICHLPQQKANNKDAR